MNPADRLPPIPPSPGSSGRSSSGNSGPQEPYLRPRAEPEFEADAEPPFATMPEVTERELQADTLAFEQVGRRRPRNWGWLKLVVVLALLGGGAYGAWHQWGDDLVGSSDDDIPTVRAPDGPFKVRPEVPGGADIPNRDKDVYALMEKGDKAGSAKKGAKSENLLPRPEMPLPPPAPAMPAPRVPQGNADRESSPQITIEPGEDDDDTSMVETTPEPNARVSNASPVAPTAPAAPRPSPEQVRNAAPPAAPPAPPPVKSTDQLAAVPPTTTPIGGKAFKIQLGAVRSESAARTEWDKLRKTFPSILGRLSLNIEKADLGQKGVYYRIQAGPFADRGAADAACQELTKQKTPCLAIRPEG